MIEINLLPEEFKTKIKKAERDTKSKQILYIIPAVFAVLVVFHVILTLLLLSKSFQLGSLNAEMRKLEPQKKILQQYKSENEAISQDKNQILQLTNQRILWAQKLNRLSQDLPAGIWFNEIAYNAKDFVILGSAVSLQNADLALINKFIENLKSDYSFYGDFNKLELNSVQRKKIGGYDVADFTLTGYLKPRQKNESTK